MSYLRCSIKMHLNINELSVFIDIDLARIYFKISNNWYVKSEQVSKEPFVLARMLQKGV